MLVPVLDPAGLQVDRGEEDFDLRRQDLLVALAVHERIDQAPERVGVVDRVVGQDADHVTGQDDVLVADAGVDEAEQGHVVGGDQRRDEGSRAGAGDEIEGDVLLAKVLDRADREGALGAATADDESVFHLHDE